MSMSLRNIPFRIGGPIQEPAYFAGREDILKQVSTAMFKLQNVSLHGERRTGKTSLLFYLAHPDVASILGLPPDYIPVYFNFQDFAKSEAIVVWQALAQTIVEQIKHRPPKRPIEAEQFATIVAEFFEIPDTPELFGTAFGRAFAHLADAGLKFNLLFDEFDQIAENVNLGDPFYDTLRSLPFRSGNVSYVIATRTGLADLQSAHSTKVSSPFFNIFTVRTLAPFQKGEARSLINSYFARSGLTFTLAKNLWIQSAFLHQITGYHPFFLQMLCYHLCARLDQPGWPLGQARHEALLAFEEDAEDHFKFYLKHSLEEERSLIKDLAIGRSIDWNSLQPIAKSLQKRCLLVPTDSGEQRLFSSVFAEWIRNETNAELYRDAKRHKNAGNLVALIQTLNQLLELDPENQELQAWHASTSRQIQLDEYHAKAKQHEHSGDLAALATVLVNLLNLEPENKELQAWYASTLQQIQLDAYHAEAKQHERSGDLAALADVLASLVDLEPENKQLRVWHTSTLQQIKLGELYKQASSKMKRQDWVAAVRLLDEIIEIESGYEDAQAKRADALGRTIRPIHRRLIPLLIALSGILLILAMLGLVMGAPLQLARSSLAVSAVALVAGLVGWQTSPERFYEFQQRYKQTRISAIILLILLSLTSLACLLVLASMTSISEPPPTETLTPVTTTLRPTTATPTNTSTHTPTNTPTDTPTNTPTDTPPANTPTDTPTNTPTDTPTPTNTPTHTPTLTPTGTPTPTPTRTRIPPVITPELIAPAQGDTYPNPISFQWSGALRTGQAYQVTAYHVDSNNAIQSGLLTGESWAADLPAELFGAWRWRVSVVAGGIEVVSSSEGEFYFDPVPGVVTPQQPTNGTPPTFTPPP